jgi:hypothetical protein
VGTKEDSVADFLSSTILWLVAKLHFKTHDDDFCQVVTVSPLLMSRLDLISICGVDECIDVGWFILL